MTRSGKQSTPMVRLGEIAEVTLGLTPTRKEGPNSQDIRIIQVGDLNEATSEVNQLLDLKEMSVASSTKLDRFEVDNGDVLLSCKGTLGKIGLVSQASEGAIATSNLIILRPRPNILPTTLLALFRSERVKRYLQNCAHGSVIPTLSYRDVESLEIPDPARLPQSEIKDVLEAHRVSVETTQAALNRREELVRGLIDKALWQ